jgi:hypothetical protein
LISDLPAVAKVDAEIAELAEMEQKYITGHAAQVDEYIAAAAAHDAAVADALNSGKLPPDPPAEPTSDAVHMDRLIVFRNRRGELQERRLHAIAAGASTIELMTGAQYGDLLEKAKPHVAALKTAAAKISELQNCRHETACAVVACDPSRGSGASRPPSPVRPDCAAVVQAVTHGLDLLEMEPDRRLGMSGNLHEVIAPTRNLEPKAGRSVQRTHSSLGMVQPLGAGR